jgi:hypothetical protein
VPSRKFASSAKNGDFPYLVRRRRGSHARVHATLPHRIAFHPTLIGLLFPAIDDDPLVGSDAMKIQ